MPYTEENYKDVERVYSDLSGYQGYPVSQDTAYHSLGAALLIGHTTVKYRIRSRGGWPRIVVLVLNRQGRVTSFFDFNDTECSSYIDNVIQEAKP
jgi:hypothetical protein